MLPSTGITERTFSDRLLFGVTLAELILLFPLTPTFTPVDTIYVLQHLLVLGICLSRCPPRVQDRSPASNAAVVVAYTYPYLEVASLRWLPGNPASDEAGIVLVTLAACQSLASLISLGRRFGVRPALRGLAMAGPYRVVRHPMYLSYVLADIGYNLQEWNIATLLLTTAGWLSLLYRINAEERILSRHADWTNYLGQVRSRLLPGLW